MSVTVRQLGDQLLDDGQTDGVVVDDDDVHSQCPFVSYRAVFCVLPSPIESVAPAANTWDLAQRFLQQSVESKNTQH
jgi:hypothetical protein